MANAEMNQEDPNELSPLWSVHSDEGGMPMMRAWAKSEDEAKALLEEIKAADEASPRSPDEKADYWVLQLSLEEVSQFKASGFIPDDA